MTDSARSVRVSTWSVITGIAYALRVASAALLHVWRANTFLIAAVGALTAASCSKAPISKGTGPGEALLAFSNAAKQGDIEAVVAFLASDSAMAGQVRAIAPEIIRDAASDRGRERIIKEDVIGDVARVTVETTTGSRIDTAIVEMVRRNGSWTMGLNNRGTAATAHDSPYGAAMKADLRRLASIQAAYHNHTGVYFEGDGSIQGFQPSTDVTVSITAVPGGWSAMAKHARTALRCWHAVVPDEAGGVGMMKTVEECE